MPESFRCWDIVYKRESFGKSAVTIYIPRGFTKMYTSIRLIKFVCIWVTPSMHMYMNVLLSVHVLTLTNL